MMFPTGETLGSLALALLLWCLAAAAQHGLERRGVKQQPALDVRIGNCIHCLAAAEFAERLQLLPPV